MRGLVGEDSPSGVARRIVRLREAITSAREETVRSRGAARYQEARVKVLRGKCDELRAQLRRVKGYLRHAPSPPLSSPQAQDVSCQEGGNQGDRQVDSGKEIGAREGDLSEYGEEDLGTEEMATHVGPVLDAFLGGDEEGGTPSRPEHHSPLEVDGETEARRQDGLSPTLINEGLRRGFQADQEGTPSVSSQPLNRPMPARMEYEKGTVQTEVMPARGEGVGGGSFFFGLLATMFGWGPRSAKKGVSHLHDNKSPILFA
ncbi:unnamed protein product [Choristocarpus tenellus]